MKNLGITGLHIADTNFGMYPRDRDICLSLKEANDTHRWPKQVIATTGKNNKERVIEITGIMGNTFNVNMSDAINGSECFSKHKPCEHKN